MATTTYVQKGQHKELSDIVENIAPVDTPFQSMIGKSKSGNTLFNWTEEDLASVGDNALIEGADAPAATDNILVERQNYTQIFAKTVSLSGSSQANSLAGDVQTMAHQVALRAKEIKRDVENAYVGTGQAAAAGTSAAARKTAGYQAQVDADNVIDKAGAAVTEADIQEVLVRLYEAGATPDVIMCHPRLRVAVTNVLTDKSGRIRDLADSTKLVNSISVYTSDVGEVELHNNRFVKFDTTAGTGDILIFDSSMWEEVVLRPYKVEELAKTGDSDKKMLVVEKGLKNRAFNSAGLITGVLA